MNKSPTTTNVNGFCNAVAARTMSPNARCVLSRACGPWIAIIASSARSRTSTPKDCACCVIQAISLSRVAAFVEHAGVERTAGNFQLVDVVGDEIAQEILHALAA